MNVCEIFIVGSPGRRNSQLDFGHDLHSELDLPICYV